MTLQEAYLIWVGTQELALRADETTQAGLRIRNRAWDVYCAMRDGFMPNHYVDRRKNFGSPLVSDSEVKRLEAGRRPIVH